MIKTDLLDSLDNEDVGIFYSDFKLLMKLAVATDKEYSRADGEIDYNLPRYEEYIKLFNKKYPGIQITPSENFERRFLPEIFVRKEKNVKDAFLNSASKIHQVRAISASGCLHKDAVTDEIQYRKEIAKMKNKVCVQYYGIISPTVFLAFNSHKGMVEVCYDPDTVCDNEGPEFKVIAYYAIKDSDIGYGIDLQTLGESICTSTVGIDTSMGGRGPLK